MGDWVGPFCFELIYCIIQLDILSGIFAMCNICSIIHDLMSFSCFVLEKDGKTNSVKYCPYHLSTNNNPLISSCSLWDLPIYFEGKATYENSKLPFVNYVFQ